jgi:acylaminoacyl-peptidase
MSLHTFSRMLLRSRPLGRLLGMGLLGSGLLATATVTVAAAENPAQPRLLRAMDVFDLQWAADPQISPDGRTVAYVRNRGDVMKDRWQGDLWLVSTEGREQRPVAVKARAPRWSPDGKRLAYVASDDSGVQLFVRWMDTGATTPLTRLPRAPSALAWSPDGRRIAFLAPVPLESRPLARVPEKPAGAEWAAPAKVIEQFNYRADGEGFLRNERMQVFVVGATGGTPRQLTTGAFNHSAPLDWTSAGDAVIVAANRHGNDDLEPLDTELYAVQLADGAIRPLTSRKGPDEGPAVSPDGKRIAYVGFDDRYLGYQNRALGIVELGSGASRVLDTGLDRSVETPRWAPNSREVVFQYDDLGKRKLAAVSLDGRLRTLASDVGGLQVGRPYTSGEFSVSRQGLIAYTAAGPNRLAEVAVVPLRGGASRRLTDLSGDLITQHTLGGIEEFWFESSHDRRRIQGWLVTPPGFDAKRRHPLLLEIHGGPFTAYGPTFAAELQLYAAAGYVVLYINPRGSTSYGEDFSNLIHHDYPGHDYEDLMSAVDTVVARGFIDTQRLYVTGGSGGGVLTAWIVGKTDRFRAAVVQKPVINWTSFALTADRYGFFYKYWFGGLPWEQPEQYFRRSPLSLVGNVKTPTMLITGEEDYRTPMSESEQYYQALKLRSVPTALVRVPGAGHGLDQRPSQLISKVAHVLGWFERYAAPPP